MNTRFHRIDRKLLHAAPGMLAGLALILLGACSRHSEQAETKVVPVARTVRTNLANIMTLQAEFEPYQDIMVHGKVSGYPGRIQPSGQTSRIRLLLKLRLVGGICG